MVCRPKDQGGLGIHDLQVKNEALLSKWLFKLLTEDGVWQTMLRNKYLGQKAVSQAYWKPGDSHFWAGLMAAKKHLFRDKRRVRDSILGRHLARQCQSPRTIFSLI